MPENLIQGLTVSGVGTSIEMILAVAKRSVRRFWTFSIGGSSSLTIGEI
jgi:hypothetical protein